ncbi:hypothetical protein [Rhizobium halophytocola]|uniref:Uncharacterized protein n=1 Tax=Rhizobium halophytocola TaxID=735519 RepID=A0ABS4E2H8_9HYPH|nr:hypothetical protein [Rhizobium halophytocola]MBP1852147.1 hypothetical protein [Rhizobium halophytocola]
MNLATARSLYLKARSSIATASPEYTRLFDHNAHRPQIGARDPLTRLVAPIATILRPCHVDDEEVLFNSRDYIEACILVAEQSFDEVRRLKREVEQLQAKRQREAGRKDYAAQCAMACDKPAFRQWLADVHGADISDRERIATRLRSILNIRSRGELNIDESAAARWKSLQADFEASLRTRRKGIRHQQTIFDHSSHPNTQCEEISR